MKLRLVIAIFMAPFVLFAQNSKVSLGAYYYNGWNSPQSGQLTKALQDTFSNRKPAWGWVGNSQDVMDHQIELAEQADLGFFCFDWYNPNSKSSKNLNDGVTYFRKSTIKTKLKFSVIVCNHSGFEISPADWTSDISMWLDYFSDPSYQTVDGKPIILFYSIQKIFAQFKSVDSAKLAIDELRAAVKAKGLSGVVLGANITSEQEAIQAASLGFDVLTGYNYHSFGFRLRGVQKIPIDSMISTESRLWSKLANATQLKYIPVCTLNWDPRPWNNSANNYNTQPYFTGYSKESVNKSTKNLISWLNAHPQQTTTERIGMLYAWNEYGEGAWLTPADGDTLHLLDGIKSALSN